VWPGVVVPSGPLALALTPGGTLEVHVGPQTLAPPEAWARIQTTSGQPYLPWIFAPDARIRLTQPRHRFERMAPGSYVFVVEGGASREFVVEEGKTATLSLP
jgi:hypothetical protein